MDDTRTWHDLAVSLARGAGELARREAASGLGLDTEAKGEGIDLVTRVDRDVERRIVHGIVGRFRDHAVLGEESGRHGPEDADVVWLVDPLDGTHNYVMGLEVYGVCITVVERGVPVVGVVHDSVSGRTTSAVRGEGAWREGVRLHAAEPLPLARTTVSWLQGYGVTYDDPFRRHAVEVLERSTKRVLRTWAPSHDWGLLAAGGTGALVAYRNSVWDSEGGILVAEEAGAAVVRRDDVVVVGVPDTVDELVALLWP